MITLGSRVRDRISGFEGIVTSESRFLTYSGRRYGVTSDELYRGQVMDNVFDEDALEVIEGAANGAKHMPETLSEVLAAASGSLMGEQLEAAREAPGVVINLHIHAGKGEVSVEESI